MSNNLPEFSINSYVTLLKQLQKKYTITNITDSIQYNFVIYLRHDIDFTLHGWEIFPVIENLLNIKSTYYIRTDQYNLLKTENKKRLQTILLLDHEIGLHYNIRNYQQPSWTIDNDIDLLTTICGQEIKTICMHYPSYDGNDPYLDYKHYINPRSKNFPIDKYISESSRHWYDNSILDLYTKYSKILLLIHPENWLNGTIKNRSIYYRKILLPLIQQDNINTIDEFLQIIDKIGE